MTDTIKLAESFGAVKTVDGGRMSGPRFCWHCGHPLRESPYHKGLLFDEYTDSLGHSHRVHLTCAGEYRHRGITATETIRPGGDSDGL